MRADDTGELESDFDGAERAGIEPIQMAQVLDELVSTNAIRRQRKGELVRYFMSPWVATYLLDPDAQRAAAGGGASTKVATVTPEGAFRGHVRHHAQAVERRRHDWSRAATPAVEPHAS